MCFVMRSLYYIRVLLHLGVFLVCTKECKRDIMSDVAAFIRYDTNSCYKFPNLKALLYYLQFRQEFRNVFYYRTARKTKSLHCGTILKCLLPPLESLMFGTERIGGGVFIQHGFSTVIHAKSIGRNVYINQQVTIGAGKTPDAIPIIGDNVKIHAGAIIIGDIRIGDNVTIGAGAVVYKDVPSNSVVVPARSRIIFHGKETIM